MAKPPPNIPNPAMVLSPEDIAAVRARLPHLAEPLKITPELKKALKLKRRIHADREPKPRRKPV
jgi:hypothetical protein